ncbi:MAG TPA: glucose 1-dehydrogenase [Candidatus Acidoferrales bacterium]|jgi:3-oxoacyl-[acyl-carrier protein] reductase|nr:glucose 1-dehydrogenase [Candidatus Acidoferrales bacterium]
MPRLKGQVAFVTGAGRGIGQAMAIAFASEGAIVGVADIDRATAAATVSEIEKSAGTARAFPIDVSRREEVHRAVDQLVAEFRRLDIVANNAIVFRREPVSEVREDTCERMISVGLKSLIWTAQAALRHMDPERGGVIINNTSPAAELGVAGSTVYSAIKGGVSSMTRSLAIEFGARRIRVNAVCPGTVPTPGARQLNNNDDALYEARRQRTPLGRLGTAEDIAAAAVFLASAEASFITAAILRIDGGVTVFGGA